MKHRSPLLSSLPSFFPSLLSTPLYLTQPTLLHASPPGSWLFRTKASLNEAGQAGEEYGITEHYTCRSTASSEI